MTRICLGIPHTPWIPERFASMERLRGQLTTGALLGGPQKYREFTERMPNAVWSEHMWEWMLETGSEWCLSLQDDVEVAPCFWPALRAMLTALEASGGVVCGLSSVHPIQCEIGRQGNRWYRTSSWLVGWAYAIRREALAEFMKWRREHPELVQQPVPKGFIGTCQGLTEDSLLNHWINVSGNSTWHPVPTLVDHDTTIDSSYGNDHHAHRRPWLTWRDFPDDGGALCTPEFWRPNGPSAAVPLLPCPPQNLCWACSTRVALVGAGPIYLCPSCVAQAAAVLITRGGTQ